MYNKSNFIYIFLSFLINIILIMLNKFKFSKSKHNFEITYKDYFFDFITFSFSVILIILGIYFLNKGKKEAYKYNKEIKESDFCIEKQTKKENIINYKITLNKCNKKVKIYISLSIIFFIIGFIVFISFLLQLLYIFGYDFL